MSELTPDDFRRIEIYARRAIRHHEIKYRERLLCEVIIDYSLAHGRLDAYIPSQSVIHIITGLGRSHISTGLAQLRKQGIIRVDEQAGLYRLNLDIAQWKVPFAFRDEAWYRAALRAEEWLAEAAGVRAEQLHLLPPPPDLDSLLAEEATDEILSQRTSTPLSALPPGAAHRDTVPARDADQGTASSLRHAPRTCGATGAPSSADLPAGEDLHAKIAESLGVPFRSRDDFERPAPAVPVLGTPHLDALSGSFSSHLSDTKCIAAPVPVLGTSPAAKPTIERELLDEIRRLCGDAALDGDGRTRGYGGFWRMAIRRHPVAVREALGELRMRLADRRLARPKNPGGLLRHIYNRFLAES